MVSDNERRFIRGGFASNIRSDGRTNTARLPISEEPGTVPEAFGSATVTFGE